MTAQKEKYDELKEPIDVIRGYSLELRKQLVRLYKFIDKFKDTDSHGDLVDFTEKGVWMAARFIQSHPSDSGSKYYKKFIANLEGIKTLIDEEPVAKVKFKLKLEEDLPIFYSPNRTDEETKLLMEQSKAGYEWEDTLEYKAYSDGDFDDFIKKNSMRRNYHSHEIIEKRNF